MVLLRWIDNDEQGDDQALAIDDLVVTATIDGQGIESIRPSAVGSQKVLDNGQVIIIRNGKKYNAMGQLIQ